MWVRQEKPSAMTAFPSAPASRTLGKSSRSPSAMDISACPFSKPQFPAKPQQPVSISDCETPRASRSCAECCGSPSDFSWQCTWVNALIFAGWISPESTFSLISGATNSAKDMVDPASWVMAGSSISSVASLLSMTVHDGSMPTTVNPRSRYGVITLAVCLSTRWAISSGPVECQVKRQQTKACGISMLYPNDSSTSTAAVAGEVSSEALKESGHQTTVLVA